MLLAFALLFADVMDWLPGLCGCCCGLMVPVLVAVPTIAGLWKVFEKAGEPGWAALVPVHNAMVLAKIAGKEPNFGLLTLIPVYGIYISYLIFVDLCKRFDKEPNYAILLLLLAPVFLPMLGFGPATYHRLPGDPEPPPAP